MAAINLSIAYAYGEGVPENEEASFKWAEKAAELGLGEAQYLLGEKIAEGRGTEQQIEKAVEWLKKAQAQSIGKASELLNKVQTTPKEKLLAYPAAPKKQAVVAQVAITPKSLEKPRSTNLFNKSAPSKNLNPVIVAKPKVVAPRPVVKYKPLPKPSVVARLPKIKTYAKPKPPVHVVQKVQKPKPEVKVPVRHIAPVPQKQMKHTLPVARVQKLVPRVTARAPITVQSGDLTMAEIIALREKADYHANYNYDYNTAVELYRTAGKAGDSVSQREVGLFYFKGKGVSKDLRKAYDWVVLAAENEDKKAQRYLGMMLYNGSGVEQNKKKSVYWLRRAASGGDQVAMSILKKANLL